LAISCQRIWFKLEHLNQMVYCFGKSITYHPINSSVNIIKSYQHRANRSIVISIWILIISSGCPSNAFLLFLNNLIYPFIPSLATVTILFMLFVVVCWEYRGINSVLINELIFFTDTSKAIQGIRGIPLTWFYKEIGFSTIVVTT
jgi:hypothetical protein